MATYHKDSIKLADPKPSKEAFALAEQFAWKGSKSAFALAMFARATGCTDIEIRKVLGGPQSVLRSRLVKEGKLAETRGKVDGRIAYRLTLPAKAPRQAQTQAAGKRKAPARGQGHQMT